MHDPFHDPYGDLHGHDGDHFGSDFDDHSAGHDWVGHHPDTSGSTTWEFHDDGASHHVDHLDDLGTLDHSVPPFESHGSAGADMFGAAGPATMGWARAFDALEMTEADAHHHDASGSADQGTHSEAPHHGHGVEASAPRFGMSWNGPDTADGHKTVISTADAAGGRKYDTVTGKQID